MKGRAALIAETIVQAQRIDAIALDAERFLRENPQHVTAVALDQIEELRSEARERTTMAADYWPAEAANDEQQEAAG